MKKNAKKYLFFIGIDISKNWIDAALTMDGLEKEMFHHRFDNTEKGFIKMMKFIYAKFKKSWDGKNVEQHLLFCMEHTGVYCLPLCAFLEEKGIDYCLESALQIKRSLGIKRGKDDKADAKAIAKYVYLHRNQLIINKLPSKELMDLKHLLAYRDRLKKQVHAIKVAAKETHQFTASDSVSQWIEEDSNAIVKGLKEKLKEVEKRLLQIVEQQDEIKKVYDLVTSVKGVGFITALQMIIHTNCFKAFDNARKFACYIGIAPFKQHSGVSIHGPSKVSSLGNKKLKALITNGVLSAIQHDIELKIYYERKVAQGKHKFSVINAVKNKLIHRVFATVKRGTPYVELVRYS